jgi:hypothetical protein
LWDTCPPIPVCDQTPIFDAAKEFWGGGEGKLGKRVGRGKGVIIVVIVVVIVVFVMIGGVCHYVIYYFDHYKSSFHTLYFTSLYSHYPLLPEVKLILIICSIWLLPNSQRLWFEFG